MNKTRINRRKSLALYLDVPVTEITRSRYDAHTFEVNDGSEWLVLTDAEADRRAKAAILDSVWAFRASWLASHSIRRGSIPESAFAAIQGNGRCEDNNDTIRALVDVSYLIRDSILADGRGHFLAGYDGEEAYANDGSGLFFYRIN